MQMADHLAADGYKDKGYEFINIDVSRHCNQVYITPDLLPRIAGQLRRETLKEIFKLIQSVFHMELNT